MQQFWEYYGKGCHENSLKSHFQFLVGCCHQPLLTSFNYPQGQS